MQRDELSHDHAMAAAAVNVVGKRDAVELVREAFYSCEDRGEG